MIRAAGLIATLAAACIVALAPGTSLSATASWPAKPEAVVTLAVPVVRCATDAGFPLGKRHLPSTLAVLGAPTPGLRLVAYSNTEDYLIGPAGMDCAGALAADGGSRISVWVRGYPAPSQRARYGALTLSLDPACLGCKAQDACPFFGEFAKAEEIPCDMRIPAGERVTRPDSHIALFTDPAGIPGSGWPKRRPLRRLRRRGRERWIHEWHRVPFDLHAAAR